MILNPEQVQAGVQQVGDYLVQLRADHGHSVEAGGQAYLSHERALWATKKTLYPDLRDEHMTADTWEQLVAITRQALPLAGYAAREVQLKPPVVPFDKLGSYYRFQPLPELPETVPDAWRQQAIQSWERPELTLQPDAIVLRCFWNALSHTERMGLDYDAFLEAMTARLVPFMQAHGWERRGQALVQPLPFDDAAAAEKLRAFVQLKQGQPFYAAFLYREIAAAGYGRVYSQLEQEPTDAMLALLRSQLPLLGYEPEPQGGQFAPKPVELPENVAELLGAALDACPLHAMQRHGEELLLRADLTAQLQERLGMALTPYHLDELLKAERLVCMRRGWQWHSQEVHRDNIRPVPELDDDRPWVDVITRATITRKSFYPFHVVSDMPVRAPVLVTDEEFDTIVIAHLLGAENAVKANWAALVGGGKVNAVNGHRVKLSGMRNHIAQRTLLPCKWLSLWLVHKAASVEHVDPLTDVTYILSDGRALQPPATFFPLLDTILPLPLQPQWAEYLWLHGLDQTAVQPLYRHSYGLTAWRLVRDPDRWQAIIERGLRTEQIQLEV